MDSMYFISKPDLFYFLLEFNFYGTAKLPKLVLNLIGSSIVSLGALVEDNVVFKKIKISLDFFVTFFINGKK